MQDWVKTSDAHCPNCKALINAAVTVDGASVPQDGDLTVCLYCGHICAYDENQQLRDLTDQEAYDAAGDPDILYAMEISATFRKMRG